MDSLPPYLQPLGSAIESGEDLLPEIRLLTKRFGFDSMTCWMATRSKGNVEGRIYELTTLPAAWARYYDENALVEVDPRIRFAFQGTVALPWDKSTWTGMSREVDAFLDSAAPFGIGSGVCVPLHDASAGVTCVDFTSSARTVDRHLQENVSGLLGDLTLIARFFHDFLVKTANNGSLRPRNWGMSLSARECQCISLVVGGLAPDAIGRVMGLTTQVVEIHFSSIRSKLGALTIEEAMAWAIRDRLVTG